MRNSRRLACLPEFNMAFGAGSGVPHTEENAPFFSRLTVDNNGLLWVRYSTVASWGTQVYTIVSPDGEAQQLSLAGTTGLMTVNTITGTGTVLYRTDPSGVRWSVTVDNNGILTVTS